MRNDLHKNTKTKQNKQTNKQTKQKLKLRLIK